MNDTIYHQGAVIAELFYCDWCERVFSGCVQWLYATAIGGRRLVCDECMKEKEPA